MSEKKYSAGAVKFRFWFAEFRKISSLLQSGKSMHKIKELAEEDNIFSAATLMRSKQIFTTVSNRVTSIQDTLLNSFETSSIETQKLIVLISIMITEAMFFDFMNEVFKEKLIIGDYVLTEADMRVFFLNKQREDDKVKTWTDITLYRLSKTYKIYLTEAGLLEPGTGDRKIIKPLIDNQFKYMLESRNYYQYLKILTGTR